MTKTLAFFLTAALTTACAGQAEVHYSGDATRPQLVALDGDPDVSVVANADEPIFFTDSTFWLYRDNTWYRSSSHRTGWTRADAPPEKVTRIAQPSRYVHYRHNEAGSRTGFNDRDAPPRPDVRPDDNRAQPAAVQTPPTPATGPNRMPNAEDPQPPRPNPLPPNQVPPVPPN